MLTKWQRADFKPYLILRYGLQKEPSSKLEINTHDYEADSGFFDSLQIVSDTEDGIFSSPENVCFALINNHYLPNHKLPRQYHCEEVAILTHEIVHILVEIVIKHHFAYLDTKASEKSFSALGEGLALAFQWEFLNVRTHYADHNYTQYLLLGKAYFQQLRRILGPQGSQKLKDLITSYSIRLKKDYFLLREAWISSEKTSNELVLQTDFTELVRPMDAIDWSEFKVGVEKNYQAILT